MVASNVPGLFVQILVSLKTLLLIHCLTNIIIYINVTLNSEPECPDSCPQHYEPVCGTDHETYPNECELMVHACYTGDKDLKVKHDGKCNGKILSTENKNSFACYYHLD